MAIAKCEFVQNVSRHTGKVWKLAVIYLNTEHKSVKYRKTRGKRLMFILCCMHSPCFGLVLFELLWLLLTLLLFLLLFLPFTRYFAASDSMNIFKHRRNEPGVRRVWVCVCCAEGMQVHWKWIKMQNNYNPIQIKSHQIKRWIVEYDGIISLNTQHSTTFIT